ncbi:alkyl/aryl-sulfatase [Ferrimonas balearica]|uniref:alkyl/aryl-sulfatase n=1 Tax=Ferrimonas balearica TaxID=44012 RepID=UPI001C99B603|nr:alkyl sulfatase dimerization domain-containing protein [Ferrimonas balearica]MBY5921673.1 MBL fold metallo-hydrolase [Ferrimonas balearica]MBY5994987.1 MBL fold metallo-hydrolase [Ferrimonas balearica]
MNLSPLALCLAASALVLTACSRPEPVPVPKGEASANTVAAQQQVRDTLPFDDETDFTLARRGLIAAAEVIDIHRGEERIWSAQQFDFLAEAAPDTANPSLWRQAQLNNLRGLFEVVPGIYQLRGFDLANMTLIEGENGWIVVDPLTAKESAHAALEFAFEHLERKPISAIIFTHAHIDHFGGALAVASLKQVQNGEVPVIAPEHFMEAATSENIIAGVAMGRRTQLMYGTELPVAADGYIGSGLGKGPVMGSFGILPPSRVIEETGERLTIDGVEMVFQLTPETESPSEFTFYLPQYKAFCGAELVSRNMHNIYTLRGAQARDALRWSHFIDEARQMFDESEVYFASHHWPLWGQGEIQDFLTKQRDIYKYVHDQTVRWFNQGLNAEEIAERITLPESLAQNWSTRGYHGSLKHNAKAVYQFYLGWYDGNPANLDPLPIEAKAGRYVALMGGSEGVMAAAQQAVDSGEYRWAAELLNHLVFAEPEHQSARALLAQAYRQLGFQAEAGSWRNSYLVAAQELQQGAPKRGVDLAAMRDVLAQTSVDKFFQSMAVRLKAEEAEGVDTQVAIRFSDLNQQYRLWVENAVMHFRAVPVGEVADADVTLTLTQPLLVDMLTGQLGLSETLFSDSLSVDGNPLTLLNFFRLFDQPDGRFNLVTP